MTVTGHKSESSLKTYSGKTCEKAKKRMSDILTEKTLGKSKQVKSCISNIDFLCLSQRTVSVEENIPMDLNDTKVDLEPLSNSQTEMLMNDLLPAAEFDDMLKEIDTETPKENSTIVKRPNTMNKENETLFPKQLSENFSKNSNIGMPSLYNCINITFNINYNMFPRIEKSSKE